ncbi:DUF4231 domain-containing protein [Nocardia sp. SYP-A9097]|uniref:DUF4231 domain-containing protein n=1 Tax=Nocardia sp. SYP-A9097 TaxID=2663237 RepID=UPI00129A771F|nr:DUF4231 domain-containing protein [Nocardia sp. SYP-A9097]MRH92379.1 DUF4231 domain-containing protein [Nocardia sp. SYP-A9097]
MNEEDEVVTSLWARRARWARAADAGKRRVDRARTAVLYLGGAGAIAAASTATVFRTPGLLQLVVTTVGAVCLAVATFLAAQFLTPAEFRRWTRARAVAESMKEVIYRFRARALPFSGDAAAARLHKAIAEIEETADDLLPYVTEIDVSHASRGTRRSDTAVPPAMNPDDYVRLRVQYQITHYYERRAREYADRARRLRMWTLMLGLAATIVSVVAAVLAGTATNASTPLSPASALTPWVAVLTTLGAAGAGHLTGRRYEFLVMSYSATARRLQQLLQEWRAAGSPSDEQHWTTFVDACEKVIAAENRTWVAKWAENSPDR